MKSRFKKPQCLKFAVIGATASLFFSCGNIQQDDSNLDIVGGTEATADSRVTKSTVALVNPGGQTFCTGSLITKRHVVTAAHCLAQYRSRNLYVAFGENSEFENLKRETLRVANYVRVHPDYNERAMSRRVRDTPPADIALVQLSNEAPAGFTPVRLLGESDRLFRRERLLLAGFGLEKFDKPGTGVLRQVVTRLAVIDDPKKEIIYGVTPGKSACRGDSGGPAFVARSGRLALVGVTSRGPANCDATGIYTDARKYKEWLTQEISKATF